MTKRPHYVIGADIGGSHICCAVYDMIQEVEVAGTYTHQKLDHRWDAKTIFETWALALNDAANQVSQLRIEGIGFAMPGPFNYREGISKMEFKYPSLFDQNIKTALDPYLKVGKDLPLRFMNDATAFAIGESWIGVGKGIHKMIAITLGTGFGSAFVEDGLAVVDRQDVASEGCFWHLPYRDGIAEDYFSTAWFVNEYKRRTGGDIDGVLSLVGRYKTEAVVADIFESYGINLAEFLAPWFKRFQADLLVVGGNVSKSFHYFQSVFEKVMISQNLTVRIERSELMEKAALAGAARMFDPVFWKVMQKRLPGL